MTTTSWRLLGVCLLAAVPALAGNELWSIVQGIAPGTQIEVQMKGAKASRYVEHGYCREPLHKYGQCSSKSLAVRNQEG